MKMFKVPKGTRCLTAKVIDGNEFKFIRNFTKTTKENWFTREELMIDPVSAHNGNFYNEYIAAFSTVISIAEGIQVSVFKKNDFLLIVEPKNVEMY